MAKKTELDVFQSISHPIRREILEALAQQELSIVAIKRFINELNKENTGEKSRTAITKHLNVLLKTGLVEKHSSGRETIFRLKITPLVEIKDWLAYFDKYWDEKLDVLKNIMESKK